MPRIDGALWRRIEAHLDAALDAPLSRRAAWLQELQNKDPDLATEVERALQEHDQLARSGFLEHGPAPLASVIPGSELGTYRLVSCIGQGGMGSVWLAERSDGRFEGRAAVKLLNPAHLGRVAEERLSREGKILAGLSHPNIAQLLDAGVSFLGQPYLLLEYVDGFPIDEHCRRQTLDVNAVVGVFLDVLKAVEYAHVNLIVHRDIKPSNVLVSRSGQVKLLDFGIAKLLEAESSVAAVSLSREAGSPMTPAYAAPEQLTGGPVTTATDVYALGNLLYLMLSGRHPIGNAHTPLEVFQAIVEREPPVMSSIVTDPALRRRLRGDLDTVVAQALKKHARDRYPSVAAFAGDLRRHLAHQPITARADSPVYRAGKFLRRNRWWLAGAMVTLAGLSTGLVVATRERAVAQKRFLDVRQLAGKLFDIDAQVRQLPGASKTRQLIVDTSLNYLARLAVDAENDPVLALEIGTAYMRSARVQGVPISPNLGQLEPATESLVIAQRFIEAVLAKEPANRMAILRSGQIAHDRMILAGLVRKDDRALEFAASARERLGSYVAGGDIEPTEADQVLLAYMNVANRYRIANRVDESLELSRRTIELAQSTGKPLQGAAARIVIAQVLRDRGNLDEALEMLNEAEVALKPDGAEFMMGRTTRFALALAYKGQLLGDSTMPNLDRVAEASAALERAYQIAEQLAKQDPDDIEPMGLMATAGLPLARLLRGADPARALQVCDTVLSRFSAKRDNARARREEVRALAGSAYALRALGREDEARARLDAAFLGLRQSDAYPAMQIEIGSEVDDALSARADLLAAAGDPQSAIVIYRELLDKGMAADLKPESSLDDAAELSRIYEALIALYRRTEPHGSAPFEAARTTLWTTWNTRSPANPYVQRQLAGSH